MKYNAVAILVLVLVLGGLGIYFWNKDTSNQTSTATTSPSPSSEPSLSAPAEDNIVTYTGSVFTPSVLTVPLGATVHFENVSSNPVWVASDPHPTHTDYPGFDSLALISQGDSYSFTFTKTGRWGYHNHSNPSETGTIVVQ